MRSRCSGARLRPASVTVIVVPAPSRATSIVTGGRPCLAALSRRLRISRRSSTASPSVSTGSPESSASWREASSAASRAGRCARDDRFAIPDGRAGSTAAAPRRAGPSRRGCARSPRGVPAGTPPDPISTATRSRASGERSSWLALASSAFCECSSAFCDGEETGEPRRRLVEGAPQQGDLVVAALLQARRHAVFAPERHASAKRLQSPGEQRGSADRLRGPHRPRPTA